MLTNDVIESYLIKQAATSRFSVLQHRIRIFRDTCCVLDLKLNDAKFSFDLIPVGGDRLHLDFVPRNRALTERTGDKKFLTKFRIGTDEVLDVAFEQIEAFLADLFVRTNHTARTPAAYGGTQRLKAQTVPPEVNFLEKEAAKRVGILTLPLNQNFGGNLQAFALADTLRTMGYDPILIDRRNKGSFSAKDTPDLFVESIKLRQAANTQFIDRNIGRVTVPFLSSQELAERLDEYNFSAIIVGSDQVWRPKYARGALPTFFLDFLDRAGTGIRKLSYAASFGADKWEYDRARTKLVKKLLAGFDAVSTREDVGADMCRDHLGRDAVHVLDPTLLIPVSRYHELIADIGSVASAGQITTYILDPDPSRDALLQHVSQRLGLQAYMTDGSIYSSGNPLKKGPNNTVERWIAAISQAEYVVTDSFHGMAFSILFNKPFVAYGNRSRGMARFSSLLKQVGLEDRLVVTGAEPDFEQLMKPIDWAAVNNRLDQHRKRSFDFLIEGLTGKPPLTRRGKISGTASHAKNQATTSETVAAEAKINASGKTSKTKVSPKPAFTETKNKTHPDSSTIITVPGAAVHPRGVLCTGCGACVSEPGQGLAMGWNQDGFLVPIANDNRVSDDALRVCPFNPQPEDAVKDEDNLGKLFLGNANDYHAEGGYFERCYAGHSLEFRETSSSGGLTTYVFDKLLRSGVVDHLFVVRGAVEGGYSYQLFSPGDDIRTTSKTRYFPVTLAELFNRIDEVQGRIAVSGVGCFVKALRLKQYYHPELRARIPFVIGIICGGLKSRGYTDYLASSVGIDGIYQNAEYRVKNPDSTARDYRFAADDAQGNRHSVRMPKLGDMWGSGLFKAKACDFCTDVTTELADLSLGDAWLSGYVRDGRGASIAVARTAQAVALLQAGIEAGELVLNKISMNTVISSQRAGRDHKRKGVKFRRQVAEMQGGYRIPHVRERVFETLSAGDMLVQILRERVRAKSHVYWRETGKAASFNRRMRSSRNLLRRVTDIRKPHGKEIQSMALAIIESPQKIPKLKPELLGLLPLVRWLHRQQASGRVTPQHITALFNA